VTADFGIAARLKFPSGEVAYTIGIDIDVTQRNPHPENISLAMQNHHPRGHTLLYQYIGGLAHGGRIDGYQLTHQLFVFPGKKLGTQGGYIRTHRVSCQSNILHSNARILESPN